MRICKYWKDKCHGHSNGYKCGKTSVMDILMGTNANCGHGMTRFCHLMTKKVERILLRENQEKFVDIGIFIYNS